MILVNDWCISFSFEDLSAKMKMNFVVYTIHSLYSSKTIMVYFMMNGDKTKENMREAFSFGCLIIQPEEKD